MNKQLREALAGARDADRLTRIEWRDRIAEHGTEAIEAVSPWITDPELGAFAVRVIEATAGFGARDEAVTALASLRRVAPPTPVRGDIDGALARLRPGYRVPGTGTSSGSRESSAVRMSARAGWDWPGFRETDFGRVEGTSWRRRTDPGALVPLLLRPLLEVDPDFSTWPIYMKPTVHFAIRDRYEQGGDRRQGWRASKLVVHVPGPTAARPEVTPFVAAAWYIEKGDGGPEYGPVNRELWDWPRLLELLGDPVRRSGLEAVMATHDLHVGDYPVEPGPSEWTTIGFSGALEDGRLVLRSPAGAVVGEGWDGLLGLLQALPVTEWHDFHIWRRWPAADAIAMGQPFALDELAPVLVDLARVYLDTVWPAGRTPSIAGA